MKVQATRASLTICITGGVVTGRGKAGATAFPSQNFSLSETLLSSSWKIFFRRCEMWGCNTQIQKGRGLRKK